MLWLCLVSHCQYTAREPLTCQYLFPFLQLSALSYLSALRSSYTDSLKSNNEEELTETGRKKKVSLPLNNIDINKEKRTQKFLLLILISHFICILPINIVKYGVYSSLAFIGTH